MCCFSKKCRAIKHLKSIKVDLNNVTELTEFNIWKRTAIDSIKTIAPTQIEILKGMDSLLTIPLGAGLFKAGLEKPQRPDQPFTQEHIDRAKNIASTYLDNLVKYIKVNGLESDVNKKSFWDKFDIKTVVSILGVMIAAVITLIVVGLPTAYRLGVENSKSNTEATRQREVDSLNDNVDVLSKKINELRDSIKILKRNK